MIYNIIMIEYVSQHAEAVDALGKASRRHG